MQPTLKGGTPSSSGELWCHAASTPAIGDGCKWEISQQEQLENSWSCLYPFVILMFGLTFFLCRLVRVTLALQRPPQKRWNQAKVQRFETRLLKPHGLAVGPSGGGKPTNPPNAKTHDRLMSHDVPLNDGRADKASPPGRCVASLRSFQRVQPSRGLPRGEENGPLLLVIAG